MSSERDKRDLEHIRQTLRKAAGIQNPRDMWYVIYDVLNLLTMIVAPMPLGEPVGNPRNKVPKKGSRKRSTS